MSNNILRTATLVVASFTSASCSAEQTANNGSSNAVQTGPSQKESRMQIRITAGDKILTARLEDSEAARDFAALLPLRLTLKDYASTEKIADLPRKLSTQGAPAAIDPVTGDLAYYAPWGNLALFYRDGHHSPGLVRLARISSGAESLNALEGPVTIEAIEQ